MKTETQEAPDIGQRMRDQLDSEIGKMFGEGKPTPETEPESKPASKPEEVVEKPEAEPIKNPVLTDDIDKLFKQEKEEPDKEEDETEKEEEKPEEDGNQDAKPVETGPKRLREELKRVNKELSELRTKAAKATELEQKAKVAEESSSKVVELEKQLAEYKKKVAATDFTQSEEFQQNFAAPYSKALDALGRIAKSYKDIDGKEINPNQLLGWVRDIEQSASEVESEIEEKLGSKPAALMMSLMRASDAYSNYRKGYEQSAELAAKYVESKAKAKEAESMNTVQKMAAQRDLYRKLADAHANKAAVGFEFNDDEKKIQSEIGSALDAAMESATDEGSQLTTIAKLRNYAAASTVLAKRLKVKDAEIAKLKRMVKELDETEPETSAEGSADDGDGGFMRIVKGYKP